MGKESHYGDLMSSPHVTVLSEYRSQRQSLGDEIHQHRKERCTGAASAAQVRVCLATTDEMSVKGAWLVEQVNQGLVPVNISEILKGLGVRG